MKRPQVHVFENATAVAKAALQLWTDRQKDAEGAFWVSLAGGSTPKELYGMIAEQKLDWNKLHLIWGDERFVPHDHADSNYRMVREAWLDKVSPPAEQVRPWTILESAEASADDYEQWLRQHKPTGVDLCLLGMGDDGHTASLFPDSPALEETERFAVSNWVEKFNAPRLTLTYPYIAESKEVLFLITGANKAAPLRAVLEEGQHPTARINSRQSLLFYVDQAAADAL
jgi:6-phosphogluconolactonase